MHIMASTDAAPAVNGNATLSHHHGDPDHTSAATKRKRTDESEFSTQQNARIQRDILEVLQRHDTTPSFLKHDFSMIDRNSANEPATKKTRLSDPDSTLSSIHAKLQSAGYTSLKHIKADARRVSEQLVSSIRTSAGTQDAPGGGRPSIDQLKQINRIQAFEAIINDVADTEVQYDAPRREAKLQLKAEVETSSDSSANDPKHTSAPPASVAVLTLFGNAPTPKQLFSSTQNAARAQHKAEIQNELMVEEMSLPNGLTATKVIPLPADDVKKGPSFEEAFPPPSNLPTLQPPKSHKRSTTRDNNIVWEFKDSIQRNNRKGGYTVQSLTVADWLSYGAVDAEGETTSPRERRKLRNRALSGGESTQQPPSKAVLDEVRAREEEALFRRAFSSFAPSYDNAKALVPEATKNMVWWHKIGNKRFNETFAIDPALRDWSSTGPNFTEALNDTDAKEEDFSNIVDDLDALDAIEPDEPEPARSKTDVDQVLRDISALLETLASYQRIRNASLASSASISRTPMSPAPNLTSKIGKPDEPAADELEIYASLKRELTYLILQLPPYALSKLNGDQFAELAISQLIPLETKNVRGTMEEDHIARQAKLAAMANASSVATLARPNSSAGQHYSTTAQRTPAIGQAANTRYGQSAQYSTRTPAAPQFQRPASAQHQYSTPTAPRPAYGQPAQYNRPGATSSNYGHSNSQQYYQQRPMQQTPGGYGNYGTYNTQYYQTPQQRPNWPAPQPMMQYQQRPHAPPPNPLGYQANQSVYNRTASPAKPAGYPTTTAPPPQPPQIQTGHPRPSHQAQQQQLPNAGRDTTTPHPTQTQTPTNGYQQPPSQTQPPPLQHAQQVAISRPASATPQPPAIDSSSTQANGHQ